MFDAIRRLITSPIFDDENKTRVAGLLNTILLALIALLPILFVGGLIGGNFPPAIYIIVGATWGVNVGLWLLMRRGQLVFVSSALLVIILAAVTAAVYFGGTIRIPGLAFYVLAILIAGLTLGRRAAAGIAFLSAVIVLGLFLAETQGRLPEPAPTTVAQWITFTVICALTTVLLHLSSRSIDESLERARRDEREIRTLNATLEQRVAARTRDLALAAEVGRGLSQVRDLQILLTDAVENIRSRFELYYTQLYLTEPNGRALLMRAGTGPVGQELHRRSLRLPFGVGSLNGTAAAERRTIIVTDTAATANFRPNPLLPDTRSEMCVPLLSGDRVVGVLDLQSARSGAFSSDNLAVFEALAAQLVIAIQNAELFADAEKARLEIEQQSRRTARAGWQEFLNAVNRREQLGYTYADAALTRLTTTPAPAELGRLVLTTPVLVSGEPVGELHLEGEADAVWAADEQELVNAVSRQVAQQLENLRLLAQAEDYQSQAEEALRRLTREGWEEHSSARPGYQYELNQEVVALTDAAPEVMALTQPLIVRGEAIGELALTGVETADDETAELVSAVADKLSAHIENLRLFDQTQTALHEAEDQTHRLARLSELGEEISRAGTSENALQATAAKTSEIVDADRTSIILLTETGDQYRTVSLLGKDAASSPGMLHPLAGTTVEMAVKQNRVVVVTDPDLNRLPRMRSFTEQGLRTFMNAPLISGGHVIGTLNVASVRPDAYTSRDENLLSQVASLLAAALENRRLFEQTQKRADREAIINTINQKIQSATSVEGALQIAAREIGQRLKARRAMVEIGTDGNGKH